MFRHIETLNEDTKLHELTQVCRTLGTTEREINFYRKRGLLHEAPEMDCPILTSSDIARLKVILAGRKAGYKTSQIAAMIRGRNAGGLKKLEQKFTLMTCEEKIRRLERKKQELTDSILNLERACLAILSLRGSISTGQLGLPAES